MAASLREAVEQAAEWIAESSHHVAFTGAGLSTDSGLPDFRGPEGVWTRRDKGLPPPSMRVSPDQVRPNAGHEALVQLQRLERLAFVISQNVDDLHRQSGLDPERLAELHGNQNLLCCLQCDEELTLAEAGWDRARHGTGFRSSRPRAGQPVCPSCGGRLVSSIVNFGDSLPERALELAYEHSEKADVFFAIGSSLVVSPANDMPRVALEAGARLILLNLGETPFDASAHLRIAAPIGRVLPVIASRVRELLLH